MRAFSALVKGRKTVATVAVLALVAGIPVTIAALHPGFPVSDVDLTSRDVWVTNGQQLLGGRLNRQIDELNGSVVASSAKFDVLQDGDTLFMHDPDAGRIEAVDPASTEVTSSVDVPKGAEVDYGGTTISVVSAQGDLWTFSSVGDLNFNYVSTPPTLKLGKGGHATITKTGVVIAVSPTKRKVYRIQNLAQAPQASDFPSVGAFQIAGVGDDAVLFDQSTNSIVTEGGKKYKLPEQGLRLQQTGAASSYAVVATADSLLEVDLGSGRVTTIKGGVTTPAKNASEVAAPVFLEGCVHGAWASSQRYVLACDGQAPKGQDIEQRTQGSTLEFRVNRTVIALNNLDNGNVWLVNENMRLVDNWDDVTPPVEQDNQQKGDEKSATQSFEDTLAQRTDVNRPPVALDDTFGIRPGRTTILSVLDNDSDPDGDVLVISNHDGIDATTGRLDLIDGGRALQFTPAQGFDGTIQFQYTVDDGRGGTASAHVVARVVPESSNQEPIALRDGNTTVEADHQVKYNVLTNWRDPDGDDLYLVGAAPKSGDQVSFTPDGLITFTHTTSELGKKEVTFQVSDGHGAPVTGTLTVDVQPAGSLDPIATPDFATAFTNDVTVIKPLENDVSPANAQLQLVALDKVGGQQSADFNTDTGQITFSSGKAGIFYLKYTVQAGAKTSQGLVRVDVTDRPSADKLPPIAVKDTAYLRGNEPTTVNVLDNDVSPTGKVLAVQSVSVPPQYLAKGLVVEVLGSARVRVTSPAVLTQQVDFTYTISDGTGTATAGVTIVPVPALTKHQPPVAVPVAMKVRAGDIGTLDVLAQAYHPDNSPMTLDTKLVSQPSAGLAFVADNKLRFQAPDKPGSYTVDFRIDDPFGETATSTATFTVTPLDEKGNRSPDPAPIVARVLAGGYVRVNVPLDGIDPDGDSAQLLDFPVNPTLGSITDKGPNYFIYQAAPGAAGTDQFSYQVYDTFGATGSAQVQIAVIPKPDKLQNPSALPDSVSVRPGRIAQVDLLANDSDPQNSPIKVSKKLIDVPKGIDVSVEKGQYLVLTAPTKVQSFSLRYTLTNELGGTAISYVLVKVDPNAPILPPTAEDIPIPTKTIAGKKSVVVNVFDGHAFNPAGVTEDMAVSVEGPNAGSADLLAKNGQIRVTPGKQRMAIAYRVTNKKDNLSAMAFILVPAAVSDSFDDPPEIDPSLPTQYVSMNETKQWKLSDILKVPSGRDAFIYDKSTVSSVQGNGTSNYVDKSTITFTPAKDYRGPASVSFTASDGSSPNDPKANKKNLRLNIIVGDPQFRDTPPTFTTPNVEVEVGETKTIDLRDSTGHPNPQILKQVTYSDVSGATAAVKPTLSGSTLSVTTPRNAKKGTTADLGVTLRWDKFTVHGTIHVTIVGSTKPLPVAVTDNYEAKRGDGAMVTHPLSNDSNPYQTTGEPLKIVDAKLDVTGVSATVSHTSDSVTITPDPTKKSGSVVVTYTIEDATEDSDREVNGTINLVVSDVPDQVLKPTPDNAIGDDGTASYHWTAPASNGKNITGYDVQVNPAAGVSIPPSCTTTASSCTLTGLTNGTAYSISVRAINSRGAGTWSDFSDPETPYGLPGTPAVTATNASGGKWAPNGAIQATWGAVAAGGGSTTYFWSASNGASGTTTGTSTPPVTGLGAGSYTFSVYAKNTGGKQGGTGTSNTVAVQNQTVPGAISASANVTDDQAPGAITWSWTAPAGGADVTDNLTYVYSIDGAAGVSTTSRSVSKSGLAQGSHSISVYARQQCGQRAGGHGVRHDHQAREEPPCRRGLGRQRRRPVRLQRRFLSLRRHQHLRVRRQHDVHGDG